MRASDSEDINVFGSGGGTQLLFANATPGRINATRYALVNRFAAATGLEVGFMDHSEGQGDYTVSLSAVALGLGVCVFEKHISLDHALALEDHVSALAPAAFANYVAAINDLSSALGNRALSLNPDEYEYRDRALKRTVAARDLSAGETVGQADLSLIRPGVEEGLFRPDEAIGRIAKHDIAAGNPVRAEDLA